jgi:hypothetical protein
MRTIMRRTFTAVITAATMLAAASLAHAGGGIAMRWDRCYGDGGVPNKNFACDTNAGSETLVMSFQVPADVDSVTGMDGTIYLSSATGSMPTWWQFKNAGSCRQTSLSLGVLGDPSAVSCIPISPDVSGGIAQYTLGPSNVNAKLTFAVGSPTNQDLKGGQEYFFARVTIANTKTTGTSSCAGCVTPICLVFSSMNLFRAGRDLPVIDPMAPNSQTVGWQSASPSLVFVAVANCPPPGCAQPGWYISSCALPTPARNQTWGAIKSLYR